MTDKKIEWLLQEMRSLKNAGIITPEILGRIEDNYKKPEKKKDLKGKVLNIFGILGGFLIGGGIVLLLAHNWSNLSRSLRASLFLGPLVALQVITGFLIYKGRTTFNWRETVGILYFILIGASIAMIGQIYNCAEGLEIFLIKWAIGGISVAYFLRSNITAVLYLVVITAWAAIAQTNGGNAVLYWPLLAAVLPKLIHTIITQKDSHQRDAIEYIIMISLTVSIGVTLEKVLPGLWIVIYSGFFTLLFLSGDIFKNQGSRIPPARVGGIMGTVALSTLLLVKDFWKDAGFEHIRDGARFHHGAALLDYILLGIITVSIIYFYASRKVKPNLLNISFSSIFPAAVTAFLVPVYGPFIFHVFTLLLGFLLLIPAVHKREEKLYTNIAFLLIALSILLMLIDKKGFSNYSIFIISCMLAVLFIKSRLFAGKGETISEKIWKAACLIWGLPLIYGLSFTGLHFKGGNQIIFKTPFIISLIIAAGGTIFHLIPYFKKERTNAIMISIFPAIALLSLSGNLSGVILYNLYLLSIGIGVILYGIYRENIAIANSGILINVLLITTRFFDIDMSFIARGLSFICIGIFFLVSNIFITRKIKREKAQ